jgi:succinate dehydrogenase / fumarate reductase membrane anchor subunit
MQYLTDRKRAQGLGSGRTGTKTHWNAIVTSTLLVPAVPVFVFTVGAGLGGTYEEVLAYFSRPVPAILTALSMIVIVLHTLHEVREAIEDYMHGVSERMATIAATAFAFSLIAAGLLALIKLAL